MNQLTNATTATIASVPTVILALNIEELKGVVGFAIMIVAFFYWTFAMITKAREAFGAKTTLPSENHAAAQQCKKTETEEGKEEQPKK